MGSLPPALPLAHLTIARWLSAILKLGAIAPRPCKVFGRDLLYLSYGGLFYRPDNIRTQQATELPVGLVFSPVALAGITSLFPFDSGAMAGHKDFSSWRTRMDPFEERFQVPTTDAVADAPALVNLLYKTNKRYLAGTVSSQAKHRCEPFPLLADFLAEDMSPTVDHRQRSIECVAETALPLSRHLVWIGFPDRRTDAVVRGIYEWTRPDLPIIRPYPYTRNFNPTEKAAQLEALAHEDIVKRFVELPV